MVVALSLVFVTAGSVIGVLTLGMATPTARAAEPKARSLLSRITEGRRQSRRVIAKEQEGERRKKEGLRGKEWRMLGAAGRRGRFYLW
jgi:hypothetical protein